MIEDALALITLGLKLYAKFGGPPIDLVQLGQDCGVEQLRIDAVQAADEAAENKEAAKKDA